MTIAEKIKIELLKCRLRIEAALEDSRREQFTPLPIDVVNYGEAKFGERETQRAELLERYQEILKALKAAPLKLCTFLSVDVVDYGEAKFAVRESEVAMTFQALQAMLREILNKYGAWKQFLWVGGATACFLDRELAVTAAQRILKNLKRFNEYDNKLPMPLCVRCGVDEGKVAIFEDTKLQKFQHLAKQLAISMAKQAPHNTLWITGNVFDALQKKAGFKKVEAIVDGHQVYEWAPEVTV
jgi:class 3 adenylate cyclase